MRVQRPFGSGFGALPGAAPSERGNVWEWCEDWYNAEQKYRVLRGGSWLSIGADYLLSSDRGRYAPVYRFGNVGFRVVFTDPKSVWRRWALGRLIQ